VLTKPEPLLPTRGYRVLCTDADADRPRSRGHVADGHPVEVHRDDVGHRVAASGRGARCRRADVDLVLRDDGAVWPPVWPSTRCSPSRRMRKAPAASSMPLRGTLDPGEGARTRVLLGARATRLHMRRPALVNKVSTGLAPPYRSHQVQAPLPHRDYQREKQDEDARQQPDRAHRDDPTHCCCHSSLRP
jgi:hypothetical protein